MRLVRPLALAVLVPFVLVGLAPEAAAETKSSPSSSASAKPPPGKINLKEFEAALRPHLAEMHACYDKSLKKNAVAEGEVVLRIKSKGGVILDGGTDLAASSMKIEAAHKCIAAVVKKIKMPIARGPDKQPDPSLVSEIRYPVEFTLGIDVDGKGWGTTGGKLDYDKVKDVFFRERIWIGQCYVEATNANKGDAAIGKLVLAIDVAGGKVTGIGKLADQTTIRDQDLEKCVYAAVKSWTFPTPKDAKGNEDLKTPSRIHWPLEFKPR